MPTNSLSVEVFLAVKGIQTIRPTNMERERPERRDRLEEGEEDGHLLLFNEKAGVNTLRRGDLGNAVIGWSLRDNDVS